MPEGGVLSLRLTATGKEVEVTIANTGLGIAAADLPRIFEPFCTSDTMGQGTALGLSVSYAIIRKHFGSIAGENALGRGAWVTVRLPQIP